MTDLNWIQAMTEAAIVCDKEGIILEINDKALVFNNREREDLIGTNVVDCHQENNHPKVRQLLQAGKHDMHIIHTNDTQFISYFSPWQKDGEYAGLIEFILEMPAHKLHLLHEAPKSS
jgi:transcriptional regulator with PAS, ATPase and Fis domain